MASNRLLFTHISDPHIGNSLFRGRFFQFPIIDRFNTHDTVLCQGLVSVLEDLSEWGPVTVMLTGDVTASGADSQSSTADRILHQPARLGHQRYGLDLSPPRVQKIPGNHDHWNGVFRQNYNQRIYAGIFDKSPWYKLLFGPKGNFAVELFGLDSNSGVAGWWRLGPSSLRAAGAVSSKQLEDFRRVLRES